MIALGLFFVNFLRPSRYVLVCLQIKVILEVQKYNKDFSQGEVDVCIYATCVWFWFSAWTFHTNRGLSETDISDPGFKV
jgi:hypothetical protein